MYIDIMFRRREPQAMSRFSAPAAVLIMALAACGPIPEPRAVTTPEYENEIRAWHGERVAKLRRVVESF
jgi:hypothetical protein